MKNIQRILFIILISNVALSQNITLEEIWTGKFSPKGITELRSMNDGEHYTVLKSNKEASLIEKNSYTTTAEKSIILNGSKLENARRFSKYFFSPDEESVILETNIKPIYRHSYTSKNYIYNFEKQELKEIFEGQQQVPTFSPDGKKIAFVKNNNIYIKDIYSGKVYEITEDGKNNEIINGVADWVYEEEFAFVKAFCWSPDSKYISYLKFDEKEVPEMNMNIFGTSLYPYNAKFKYPKAGEKNSKVSIHIYNLIDKTTRKVEMSEQEDFYIPRIKWNKSEHKLSYITLNRHQNKLKLNLIDAKTMKQKTILEELSKTYIDIDDDLTFLDDNSFIWTSDKSGFKHIYHYTDDGKLIKQVTKGNWEITDFYGYNKSEEKIYYQSTENGSINRGVYSISINGKNKSGISVKKGVNSAKFSFTHKYYINRYSNADSPATYSLHSSNKGKLIKIIEDNRDLKENLKSYNMSAKEFFTINIGEKKQLNAWMIKPIDFDKKKKYPVFMYVYGGPGSQTVKNEWQGSNYMWFEMLAQKGYIVVSVDNRGTGGKGAEFKKVTYKKLGDLEIEDQIYAAKYLSSLKYVDKERIGMFGWSYGGFMTSLAMTKGAEIFKMGIAVAPVINWKYYDSVYTERYMQTPSENKEGYDDNSPLKYVSQLKGAFLLIHGTADDNVHYQNTMKMVEALVQANKQFDLFIYPDKNHSIYGGNTRLHLYKKMTDFIEQNL